MLHISAMTFSFELNFNTIIEAITLFVIGIIWDQMKRDWNRKARMHKLHDIKLESVIYSVENSLNGHGELFKMNYDKKKKELMSEEDFTDGE